MAKGNFLVLYFTNDPIPLWSQKISVRAFFQTLNAMDYGFVVLFRCKKQKGTGSSHRCGFFICG